jgi:hypothetical protein
MEEMRNAYKILIGKPEGKRSLGIYAIWEVNIRMHLMEIWWKVVNWIHLAQDRDQWRVVVNTVMKFQVP